MTGEPLSLNCRDAQAHGLPNDAHRCTGCPGCPCHHIPPPADFRERVEAARTGEAT